MKSGTMKKITRLAGLQQQIALLTHLKTRTGAVLSCYLDLSQAQRPPLGIVQDLLDNQLAQAFGTQASARASVIQIVEQLLADGMPPRTRGLAFFVEVDEGARLVAAIPLAVPLRNSLTISRAPDLLPLIQLKTQYGRFRIALVRREGIQVAEVNLGDIAVKAWVTNPQHGGTDSGGAFRGLQRQVGLVEHYLGKGGPCPMFLAGDSGIIRAMSGLFSTQVTANLLGAVPLPAKGTIHQAAAACLRTLLDFEHTKAEELVARTLRRIRHHGAAVAGPAASIDALRSGADRQRVSSGWRLGMRHGREP